MRTSAPGSRNFVLVAKFCSTYELDPIDELASEHDEIKLTNSKLEAPIHSIVTILSRYIVLLQPLIATPPLHQFPRFFPFLSLSFHIPFPKPSFPPKMEQLLASLCIPPTESEIVVLAQLQKLVLESTPAL